MSTVAPHTAQDQPERWPVHRSARRDGALNSVIISSQTGEEAAQPAPELLRASGLEQLERRALLLDPRVVAEVEDAGAIALGALDRVCGGHVGQMLAPHRGRVDVGELAAEVARAVILARSLGYSAAPSVATVIERVVGTEVRATSPS